MTYEVIEQPIEIPTPDGTSDGFIYRPQGQGPWPGAIHLTDIAGIRSAQQEMAKRLASAGYVVLLPNIFYRTSRIPVFGFKPDFGDERTRQRIPELSGPLTPDAMVRDGSAYVDFLGQQNFVTSEGIGVVGYCFSGSMALRIAAERPDKIVAAASFHGGRLYTDAPTSPHLLLPKIKARLYFGHAVNDNSMPSESIAKLEQALQAWGGNYESETYQGAHHSWTTLDSPVYNQPQAERAFQKLTALFAEALKNQS